MWPGSSIFCSTWPNKKKPPASHEYGRGIYSQISNAGRSHRISIDDGSTSTGQLGLCAGLTLYPRSFLVLRWPSIWGKGGRLVGGRSFRLRIANLTFIEIKMNVSLTL